MPFMATDLVQSSAASHHFCSSISSKGTSFSQVEISGNRMKHTMNTLYSTESKLQVGLDRTEGQGIIVHDLAFPSKIEFDQFYAPLN